MQMRRLFIGGYRELKRPVNIVDESLMARIQEARRRLQLEGKEIKPVRTVRQIQRPQTASDRRVIALRTKLATVTDSRTGTVSA